MSNQEPKYDGVPITVGGKTYIVPPLNFKRIKKLAPMLGRLNELPDNKIPTPEELGDFLQIVHLALTRNYPEMTMDEVEEMVDLGNLKFIMASVMGVSGFVKGETLAGQGAGPTGIKSTAT